MLVSVLIPTLNRRLLLREALRCALAQTYPAIEIIVSDDGSCDQTVDYVAEVARSHNGVRLVQDNPKRGLFENMNHLVAAARGDALCFLADDDRIDPDFVGELVRPLEKDPRVGVVFCDHRVIDKDGRLLLRETRRSSTHYGRSGLGDGAIGEPLSVALRQSICLGFAMWRAALLGPTPFDVLCGGAADWDLALRVAAKGKAYYVDRPLGDYRSHSASATGMGAFGYPGVHHMLQKHSFTEPLLEARRVALLRECLSAWAIRAAPRDRDEALAVLMAYRASGGAGGNARVILAELAVDGPRPVRSAVLSILGRYFGAER